MPGRASLPTGQAYLAYQSNQVQTQSQEKLVLMLYDAALRFIRQAQEALAANRYDRTTYYLGRAQDILTELMVTLNFAAGSVAHNLYALYAFMYRHLIEANVRKDAVRMAQVERLLKELRDAWEEATRVYHSHNYLTRPEGLDRQG
jgi:flagellar protein FliS